MLELSLVVSFIFNTFMLVKKLILFNAVLIMVFKMSLQDFIKRKFEGLLVMDVCGKFAEDMLARLLAVVIQDKTVPIGLTICLVVR